jgi:cellulose synthase/poly-beta-1,6-N-acetylglucosamine synthase-like glycosyltransferase
MTLSAALILSIHYLFVSVLCIYGAHRIYHSIAAGRLMKRVTSRPLSSPEPLTIFPKVTIQIPLYNEKFVVARIIDRVTEIEYPKDRLQIQVIDDSTDESVQIVAERVAHYKTLGFEISHVRRLNRAGYKAGALADAMDAVTGEFIAIFDADFLPEPDFLMKTIGEFTTPDVGLVQTRWSYLNTPSNTLTKLQTIMLDAHFGVEQVTRFGQGVFFNFNGTAGIWRKSTIEDAGGWKSDTLTEDTDLSYRAQLKGWKFIYRPDVTCPSEIPETMRAFKIQQHRWAKGTIEVMKKILLPIWKAPISLRRKFEASLHLTANITYLLMFVDSLFLLLPSVHIRQQMDPNLLTWLDLPIFAFASLSHAYFFLSGQKRLYGKVLDKLFILPALLATSIGLGVNNGRAVIEALVGYKTGFARTPKVGVEGKSVPIKQSYQVNSENWSTTLELALAILYTLFLIWACLQAYWIVVPFLSLFAIGFFYTSVLSIKEAWSLTRAGTPLPPTVSETKIDSASEAKSMQGRIIRP